MAAYSQTYSFITFQIVFTLLYFEPSLALKNRQLQDEANHPSQSTIKLNFPSPALSSSSSYSSSLSSSSSSSSSSIYREYNAYEDSSNLRTESPTTERPVTEAEEQQFSCSNNVTDEYFHFYDNARKITGLIVYPILCFIGITGNIMALVVLAHKDMRTSTNVYLSTLAVSDTIKLLNDLQYFIIIAIAQYHPEEASKAISLLYPLAHYVFSMSVCVTAWITVSVAVERYISVCYPSKAKTLCTITRARLVCTIVFISMSVVSIPTGLRYEMKTVHDAQTNESCVKTVPTELGNNKVFMVPYAWIHNTLRGIIPVFILAFLNIFIIKELRKERVKGKKFTARNRITLMLIVIIIVFLVCITPDAIMSTVFGKGYVEEGNFIKGIREITDSLLAVNSALSFILYCSMSAAFRTTFIKIMCPHYAKKEEHKALLLNRRTPNNNSQKCANNGTSGESTPLNKATTSVAVSTTPNSTNHSCLQTATTSAAITSANAATNTVETYIAGKPEEATKLLDQEQAIPVNGNGWAGFCTESEGEFV